MKLKSIRRIALSLIIGVMVLQTGCGVQTNSKNVDTDKASQEKTLSEFKSLISKDSKLQEVIEFVDNNISKLSKEEASNMVITLEESAKKILPKLEDKFYKTEGIQEKLSKIYTATFELPSVDSIDDEKLKNLLIETRDTGYRLETAEGMFFPIINYEFYKKYSSYVTPDIKEYIDIMAVESSKVPAKDAALLISFEEIIDRALKQENFINAYKDSSKINDIKELYKKYLTFALLGTNNTPLFSYEANTMNPSPKEAYSNAIKENSDSLFIKTLKDFMELLEKDNYKLTDIIDKYRKNIIGN